MKLNEIMEMDHEYYMNTFGNRTPVCFTRGEGIYLWDTEGKRYADFLGGIAVNALGHCHPALVEAIRAQAGTLMHCSNLYYIKNQALLAQLLVQHSCADKVFFANSGAEANEGAIKLARIYFRKQGLSHKYEIITMEKSFHGRTLATVAATGQEKYRKPYEPLTPGFAYIPLNDCDALDRAIGPNTCAIMLEPIQGESGVHPVSSTFIQHVVQRCKENNLLLIFDEVQCGLGRTGKLFGYEHLGVQPDIFTLAKALGGGFPIGAVCAKAEVAAAFEPGDHGSTFGGNPLACAAGLAMMHTLLEQQLCGHAAQVGEYLKHKLASLSPSCGITEVRGTGLMLGLQLSQPVAGALRELLFHKGYLVGSVGTDTLRLLPPLILTPSQADDFVTALEKSLQELSPAS